VSELRSKDMGFLLPHGFNLPAFRLIIDFLIHLVFTVGKYHLSKMYCR
jgi:hypothetical protein